MPRFQYGNFPFPFYRSYYRVPPRPYNVSPPPINNTPPDDYAKNEDCRNFSEKNKSNKNTDDCLFDLFGLKIYSDDVLLVSLLYFLYSEGVKDDGLFLVLILLLLS